MENYKAETHTDEQSRTLVRLLASSFKRCIQLSLISFEKVLTLSLKIGHKSRRKMKVIDVFFPFLLTASRHSSE
jgi:hypothetical protein